MKQIHSIAPVFFILAMLGASLFAIPAYCNRAEAGGGVIMTSGSVSSSTSARFITSGDSGVELNHNIRVTDTVGKATAYMNILSMEGRGTDGQPYEIVSFRESTTVQGLISLFEKRLQYTSALTGDTI